ncbi:MAG TPA: DUF2889 domain-containing protein [Burkholderiaceae bacterium]|jgi:hypothetical protein
MPSELPSSPRQLMHRRALDVQVFSRDDGLFEVEASVQDTKTRDVTLGGEQRSAGTPVHQMVLRLVVDEQLTVRQATSSSPWTPYPGHCDKHGDAYARLAGLNLMKNFRAEVKTRLGGVQGCTHLTELCSVLPTAVLQAFAGVVINVQEGEQSGQQPWQIDRCHALRGDGPVVQTHYPRWYRKPGALTGSGATPASPAS